MLETRSLQYKQNIKWLSGHTKVLIGLRSRFADVFRKTFIEDINEDNEENCFKFVADKMNRMSLFAEQNALIRPSQVKSKYDDLLEQVQALIEGKEDRISEDASEYFENVKPFLKDDELWKDDRRNKNKGDLQSVGDDVIEECEVTAVKSISKSRSTSSSKRKITDDDQVNQRPRLLTNDK
ncbi:14586_t:CDS:2 [Funneliformis geosporum]|uniref:14586_t:CDS:1 n=1 Tax=Funneliformis geosporum TaxID=1117311 RepID=A0A9W4WSZ7_9GLOM|nr:14586_t:CDS:2 [Funneliformis geosporum]